MSMGIPPSASTSIFGSSLLARPEAKLVVRYCASPPLSMSRSLGGIGGGGRSFLYLVETTISCLKPPLASLDVAIFATGNSQAYVGGQRVAQTRNMHMPT